MHSIEPSLCHNKNLLTRPVCPKPLLRVAVGILVCLALPASAQTFTDDIKVGDELSAAGIAMRGYSPPVLPLPPGRWEVVARSDENFPLTNRLNEVLSPAPKVVLTLVNKELLGKVFAAVVNYSPEVVPIRWTNPPCAAPRTSFTDSAGTTPESLDYACARVWYHPAGLQRYIANAASSENEWEKKYIAPLARGKETFPDPVIWVVTIANRDRGRLFEVTLLARSTLSGKVEDSFDQGIRTWVNGFEKALIGGLHGDKASIAEFPAPPLP